MIAPWSGWTIKRKRVRVDTRTLNSEAYTRVSISSSAVGLLCTNKYQPISPETFHTPSTHLCQQHSARATHFMFPCMHASVIAAAGSLLLPTLNCRSLLFFYRIGGPLYGTSYICNSLGLRVSSSHPRRSPSVAVAGTSPSPAASSARERCIHISLVYFQKILQNFSDFPSHQIFRCMHEVLNIIENKN